IAMMIREGSIFFVSLSCDRFSAFLVYVTCSAMFNECLQQIFFVYDDAESFPITVQSFLPNPISIHLSISSAIAGITASLTLACSAVCRNKPVSLRAMSSSHEGW